jgi:hypothetical protein
MYDCDATTSIIPRPEIKDPKDRLRYLSSFLRSLPRERFDLSRWIVFDDASMVDYDNSVREKVLVKHCGTAACVCGWAHELFNVGNSYGDDHVIGGELGLTPVQRDALFAPFGNNNRSNWDEINVRRRAITPQQAADTIDRFLETGVMKYEV